jgi:hypothetical protein
MRSAPGLQITVAAIALVSLARPAAADSVNDYFLITNFYIHWTNPAPTDEFRWCIDSACLVQSLPAGQPTYDIPASSVAPLVAAMTDGIEQTVRLTAGGVNYDRPESFYVLPDNDRETNDGTIWRWSRGSDWPPYDVDWHGLEIHWFQLFATTSTSANKGVQIGIYGTVPEPATGSLLLLLLHFMVRRQR